MSWASVGSFFFSTSTSFTLTPSGVGNLYMLEVNQFANSTVWASGVSSSNVTWTQVGTHILATGRAGTSTLWMGTVTAASGATVTISWSGTTPGSLVIDGHEFSSTAGSWAADNTALLNGSGTNTWPSIAAASAGELYFGAAVDNGTCVAGSTSGFTYNVNADSCGAAYNLSCSSGTVAGPVWGDSQHMFGVMALIQEISPSPPAMPVQVPPGRRSPQAFRFRPPLPPMVPAPQTYYVSPSGSDSNSGLSPASAWQTVAKVNSVALRPGDTVLFESGQSWTSSTLFLTSQGSTASPITIGIYNGSANATISNGANNAVYIQNAGGYRLQNITAGGVSGSTSFNGIQFFCSGTGQLPAIELDSCSATGWQYGLSIGGSSSGDGYNGITVNGGTWNSNLYQGIQIFGPTFSSSSPVWSHANLLITGVDASGNLGSASVTGSVTGFGASIGSVSGGTVQNSTFHGNGTSNGDTAQGPVGCMLYACSGVTIQNCLAYANGTGTTADGEGFDLDIDCTGCTIQYCLSYGNQGAGIICYGGTGDSYWGSTAPNTVRWNVTWGNGTIGASNSNYGGELTLAGNLSGLQAYNNTFVAIQSGSAVPPALAVHSGTMAGCSLRNNIFYIAGSSSAAAVHADSSMASTAVLLQGNSYWSENSNTALFWGISYATLAALRSGVTGQEVNGASNTGIQVATGLQNPDTGPAVTTVAAIPSYVGIALVPGSPAIGAGLDLNSLFSINPGTLDFYGATISVPLPIGADFATMVLDATAAPAGAGSTSAVPVISVAAKLAGSGAVSATGLSVVQVTAALAGSGAAASGVAIGVSDTAGGSGGASSGSGLGVASGLQGLGGASPVPAIGVKGALAGSGGIASGVAIDVFSGLAGSGSAGGGTTGSSTQNGGLAGAGAVRATVIIGATALLAGSGGATPGATIGVTDALGGSGGASSGSGLGAASGLAGAGSAVAVPALIVAGSLAGAGYASTPNPNIVFVTAALAGAAYITASAPSALAGALAGAGSAAAAATVSATSVLAGSGGAAAFAPSQLAGAAAGSGMAGSAAGKVIIKVTAVLAGSGYAVPVPERTFSVTAALAGAAGVVLVPEVFTPVYVDISVFVGPTVTVLTAGASVSLGRAVSATRNDGWAAGASAGDGKSAAASKSARGVTSASKSDGWAAGATESVLTAGASIAQRGR